jgi:hypothetical protein
MTVGNKGWVLQPMLSKYMKFPSGAARNPRLQLAEGDLY